MITILDIGCRYGIYPLFKDNISSINYIGVDADQSEINRLRKKYKKLKNVKFFHQFLSSSNGIVDFYVSAHKGYGSGKKINSKSLWFNIVRKNEKSIKKKIKIKSVQSGSWIDKNVKGKKILKLDIEGGELDFLNGLDASNFKNIDAVIVESHFDNPYLTDSNFGTIFEKLKKNNYWLLDINLEKIEISKYAEQDDLIPNVATTIFLKKEYQRIKFKEKDYHNSVEVLFYLNKLSLLICLCKKIGYKKLKKHYLFNKIKFKIGHKFNRLKKNGYSFISLNKDFKKMFNENMLDGSDFYESNFYNPN